MGRMKNKLVIGICDDEKWFIDELEKICKCYYNKEKINYEILKYEESKKLWNETPILNLLFLDIEMPGVDGLTLAKKIMKEGSIQIVFVSSHKEFVREGYKVKAFRFIYKPFEKAEIEEVLEDVRKEWEDNIGITLSVEKQKKFIRFKDIVYIESLGDGSSIYLDDENLITYQNLRYIDGKLDGRFFRCHKSYIINMSKIQCVQYKECMILLNNNQKIPVAVRKKGILKEQYHDYIKAKAKFK